MLFAMFGDRGILSLEKSSVRFHQRWYGDAPENFMKEVLFLCKCTPAVATATLKIALV